MGNPEGRAAHAATPKLAIVGLLLSVSAGLAQPASPDTVVAVPYTPTEGEGFGKGDYILVTFDSLEEAEYYRLWRELLVTLGVVDGSVVELDTPRSVLIAWDLIGPFWGGSEEPEVRVVVDTDLGTESTARPTGRWAVTALYRDRHRQETSVEIRGLYYLQSGPRYFQVRTEAIGTGVRAASWADVKWFLGGVR